MKFTIIGAGNGGQSMAAHLTSIEQDVILYDVQTDLIAAINERGGIKAEGVVEGFFASVEATTDLEKAMKDTDVIMVTTTGPAHKHVAKAIVPFLQDEQTIMILPGYWGALEFRNVFKEAGCEKNVYVAETESLIYTCRSIEPGYVRIRKIKEGLEFATLPAVDGEKVKSQLMDVYPQLKLTDSVLTTTLNNTNPVFHVPITLFNAGRIEAEGDFYFYPDGATPSIVQIMEKLEEEKRQIAEKLQIDLATCQDLLARFYQVEEKSLYEALQKNPAYQTGKAPTTLNYRYIYEDIPYGLYPLVKLGEQLGVEMKTSKLLIETAELLVDKDLQKDGLELSDLGLADMSGDEMKQYLIEGVKQGV